MLRSPCLVVRTVLSMCLPCGCLERDLARLEMSLAEDGSSTSGPQDMTEQTAEPAPLHTVTGDGDDGPSGNSGAEWTTTTDTAGTADGSSTSASSEAPAFCGNGVQEPDEECDDGDPIADNGCDNTCAADVRAFVTSVTYKAGQLEALHLADATCFQRAADAGLADALRFKAFLSDSQTDARDRFNQGRGRIVMVNGLVLAASWAALLAGDLQGPLEVTETSETYHGKVWSGTRPDGTAVPGSSHCTDWTSNSFVDSAYYGYSDEISAEWILADQMDNPAPCNALRAVYCFENF